MRAVEWAGTFPKFSGGREGYKPGLERMEAMLERLGNPHSSLQFIHVAGTNGKGSTCSFLASIYEQAGLSVGLYTSPYLETFHDRMRINGRCVTDEQLDRYMALLKPVVESISSTAAGAPTEFELVTAMGILFFAEEKPDVVVWETGLGGRLDATNVVRPLVSVITNIGLEHQHILGTTEPEIALEKAGIIKPGIPVVTGATGEALTVIENYAAGQSADCHVFGRDFTAELLSQSIKEQRMRYDSNRYRLGELTQKLLGKHQVSNAALAIRTAELIEKIRPDWKMNSTVIRRGISCAVWPGRFEVLSSDPLVILDGAHNPHGINALTETVEKLLADKPKTFVIGILKDKVAPEILGPLSKMADRIILTQPDIPRAAKVQDLEQVLADYKKPVFSVTSVPEAVNFALSTCVAEEAILITGSLFTISEARAFWKNRNKEGW